MEVVLWSVVAIVVLNAIAGAVYDAFHGEGSWESDEKVPADHDYD